MLRRSQIALALAFVPLSFVLVSAETNSNHPYENVAKACRPTDASFEDAVDHLQKDGWVIVSEENHFEAITVIGDGLIQSNRVARSPSQLQAHRAKERSAIGTRIKRPISSYFKSATFIKDRADPSYVNVFYEERTRRLKCSAATTLVDPSYEDPTMNIVSISGDQIENQSSEIILRTAQKKSSLAQATINILSVAKLNKHLDSPLKATSSLTIIGRRQEKP